MYQINDYLIYKRQVCVVKEIKEHYYQDHNYYVLAPVDNQSLTISVPVDNEEIRDLISKEEVNDIINQIADIEVFTSNDRLIENEYKSLLNEGSHVSLIKIIKTTYARNKERIDNNKKISGRDENYFKMAEAYLYNEFAVVLGMPVDDVKQYVIDQVGKHLG